MKHIIVTAAILTNNDQILCMQRAKSKFDYISYKYEFPGGKVEKNESHEEGLSRELKEEMDLDIKVCKNQFFKSVTHEYPDFIVTLHSYLCSVDTRKFELKEHESFIWLNKTDLLTLDWALADIPIVKKLMGDTINE